MKKLILKWIKRILFLIIICVGGFFLTIFISTKYEEYSYQALCKKGMEHIEIADSIAMQIVYNHRYFNEDALQILLNSAEKGNIKSQLLLGKYYKGYEIYNKDFKVEDSNIECYACDDEKSIYWLRQAALMGSTDAIQELGHSYFYGIGVPQNFQKALQLLMKAANANNIIAQWRLGNIYYNGIAIYEIEFNDCLYVRDNTFVTLNHTPYHVKKTQREHILRSPSKVILSPNITLAKYYLEKAAKQGLQKAKYDLVKTI